MRIFVECYDEFRCEFRRHLSTTSIVSRNSQIDLNCPMKYRNFIDGKEFALVRTRFTFKMKLNSETLEFHRGVTVIRIS